MSKQSKGSPSIMRGPHSINMKKVKIKNVRQTIFRLLKYIGNHKLIFIVAIFLVISTALSSLVIPFFSGKAVDFIFNKNMERFYNILTIMAIFSILVATLSWMQSRIFIKISQNVIYDIRQDLFRNSQNCFIKYFDENSTGNLMSRFTNDINNINNVLTQGLSQFISSGLTILGIGVMLFVLSWQLALVTLAIIPIITFVVKNISKKTRNKFREQQKYLGEINGIIQETIASQHVVKTYAKEDFEIKRFVETNQKLRKSSVYARVYAGMMGPLMGMSRNISYAVVACSGAIFAINGLITVGIITSFLNYVRRFIRPINQIAQLYNQIQIAIAGAERVFEMMDEKSEYSSIVNRSKKHFDGNVELKNIVFGYNKANIVIDNLSIKANKNETIALVGHTGAGKTTIINLLNRFYEIDSGEILFDNINIKNIDKKFLRKEIGLVLQDTRLFSDTIMENIRYGDLNASSNDVIKAAKISNAHQFIERLPNGYQTVLNGDGANLSHGQRQLLSIARVVLKNPSILILDEATSSVDTRTEMHIQEGLNRLMKGKTSFIIAHRLSTIVNADNIYLIEDGKVMESGHHNELIKNKSYYYELYKLTH